MRKKLSSDWPTPSEEVLERIGDIFQQATKYSAQLWSSKWKYPRPLAFSPDERYLSGREIIELPEVDWNCGGGFWPTAYRRRSVREYSGEPLTLKDLSQLLGAGQGVTSRRGSYAFLASPSAGAIYPIETYLVVHRGEGIEPGVYHYRTGEHELEVLARGDFRSEVARAALGQSMAGKAAVVFIWTAVIERSRQKYGQRCYRYIYLEAGHLAQILFLAAVTLNLGTCMIGALYDALVNKIIRVDGIEETVIYMSVVGRL